MISCIADKSPELAKRMCNMIGLSSAKLAARDLPVAVVGLHIDDQVIASPNMLL